MIIGLTGSIGSGKSTASDRLAFLGAHVLDADAISRAVTEPGGDALPAIRALFGKGVFGGNGALDRHALAAIIFADAGKRRALNGIIHPLVLQSMQKSTAALYKKDPGAVVIWDVPLLIEVGWRRYCDEVWLVRAGRETRVARVVARDGCTPQEALARIQAQMSDAEKARFADEIVDNNGDIASLFVRVDALYARAAGKNA